MYHFYMTMKHLFKLSNKALLDVSYNNFVII